MILPLLKDTLNGRSYIDAEIEERVIEVRQRDHNDPFELLEPNEQIVARMLAQGLTNEQIAARLGFRDKRTISRTNGQIYNAWNLASTSADEKVARVRAAIIVQAGQLIYWDENGTAHILDQHGDWVKWDS
jgi:DNA-binding NarL/FixJ family response regulator